MSKSQIGQTNKYSGIKNTVKDTKSEEPKITPEQVVMAFQSFNFKPNERGMNDIGYWTTRPQSEGHKLMEELRKRRMEINAKEDETTKTQEALHKSKESLSRLSDDEINALFDEYGLPAPDMEWARNHLPNDPKKIRSILEMQRKATDDLLKKHTKNMVNSVPEVPKMSQQTPMMSPQTNMSTQPNMGMGGPNPVMGDMGTSPASPFFIGDHSIVKILNPQNPNSSTLWLVDQKKKILRPFESEEAFQNAFEDPEAAQNSIITLSPKDLGPGGALDGFKMMGSAQGIKTDGSMEDVEFSPTQLAKRYGQPSDPEGENKALSLLDGLFGKLKNSTEQNPQDQNFNNNPEVSPAGGGQGGSYDGQGGPEQLIYGQERNPNNETFGMQQVRGAGSLGVSSGQFSQSFLNSIMNNPEKIALYVNSLRYGGYQVGDILNDMKREEMKLHGDQNASKIKIIDPEIKRSDYLNSADGIDATVKTRKYIPTVKLTGNINPEILKYGINMPDNMFKALVPILDINSQEFKTSVENVKASFYDLAMQQLQAESEQEKVIADANMAKFKESLNKKYGITLSDNATTAWKQLETIGESMTGRGLQGSGIEGETIDDYLRAVRNKDSQNRQAKLSEEDVQTASYYKASATPQQVQALIAEDQAKGLSRDQWRATKWGLVPSDDIKQKYSIENLRKMFPDSTEEQLNNYKNTVLDEFGNYRSTLYSNYYSNLTKTQKEKQTYKETEVMQQNLDKDEHMRELVDRGQSFSSLTEKDKQDYEGIIPPKTEGIPKTKDVVTVPEDDSLKSAGEMAGKVGTGSVTGNQNVSSDTAMNLARAMGAKPTQLESLKKTLTTYPTTPISGTGTGPTVKTSPKTNVYSGPSIIDYLGSTGQASDMNSRATLAKKQGLSYDVKAMGQASATQNINLLKKLRGY